MPQLAIDTTQFKRAATAFEATHFRNTVGPPVSATLRKGGNAVRKHVRGNIHSRSGKTRSKVTVFVDGTGLSTRVKVHAGGPVAHLLESGAQPHSEPKEGGSLRGSGQLGGSGKAMTIRSAGASNGAFAGFGNAGIRGAGADVLALRTHVSHPGMAAQHFFARGVEEAAPEVQQAIDAGALAIMSRLSTSMRQVR